MSDTVQILASCTERKRLPVPKELRLGSVHGGSIAERAARWRTRLTNHGSATLRAFDLYAGGHWSVVRRLPEVARSRGFQPELWVVSAGYGLVPSSTRLHAYSATFTPGDEDSVSQAGSTGRGERRAWWSELTGLPGPNREAPHSVRELAAENPGSAMLVLASEHYVDAMEADLLEAVRSLTVPERLIVITTPGRIARGPLGMHVIEAEAIWQPKLGGARGSLHARLAQELLEGAHHSDLRVDVARAQLTRVLEGSRAVAQGERQRMMDEELRTFIREALSRDPKAGHTKLLRALRESGRACEQSRFREMFLRVTGRRHEE